MIKHLTKELLETEILINNKTKQQVAQEIGCGMTTIYRFIKNNNLKLDKCLYCKSLFHAYHQEIKWCSTKCHLLDKIEIFGECWNYKGCNHNKFGYKRITHNNKRYLPHRLMYILEYGDIPDNLLVCHKCDNPACINPSHLFLGTYKDNNRDCLNKGNHKSGIHRTRLNKQQKDEIRKSFVKGHPEFGLKALTKKYNISFTTASKIINLKS